jgi:hypothetical protein
MEREASKYIWMFGGGMVPLGDVTCVALVRDEHEPVKDVLLTGSLSGWVHCWNLKWEPPGLACA